MELPRSAKQLPELDSPYFDAQSPCVHAGAATSRNMESVKIPVFLARDPRFSEEARRTVFTEAEASSIWDIAEISRFFAGAVQAVPSVRPAILHGKPYDWRDHLAALALPPWTRHS